MVPSAVASTSPARYIVDIVSRILLRLTSLLSSSPSTSPLTDKQILDDTSIAALALPNGDRRLFFQDLSGVIRQAFHSSSSGKWRADTKFVVASNARTHSPIAAVNLPSQNYSTTGNGSTVDPVSPRPVIVSVSFRLSRIIGLLPD